MLGEDEDWLRDVATEMDQEDGLIWVYRPGDESVMLRGSRCLAIGFEAGWQWRSARPSPRGRRDRPAY
jgi:hypothetical protein